MPSDPDVYTYPEKFGLNLIGEIAGDASGDYGFDIFVVWKNKYGKLYWGEDSGCSCPSPFEDYHSVSQLNEGSMDDLLRSMKDWQQQRVQYVDPTDIEYLHRKIVTREFIAL